MHKYKEKMKILIVEDDKTLNNGIAMTLGGYEIVQAYHLAEARRLLADSHPDLVLLDINLSDGSGLDFCRELKKDSDVPVIFLTANDMEIDVVAGLESGASDYITKPFSLAILRARVAAHLRRELREKKHLVTIGEVEISLQAKQISCKGQQISLTKSEYAICEYLALNRGQVFSKEQIYEHVFGYDGEADSSAITEHIKNIRAKFQKYEVSPVETVWGIGYRWK